MAEFNLTATSTLTLVQTSSECYISLTSELGVVRSILGRHLTLGTTGRILQQTLDRTATSTITFVNDTADVEKFKPLTASNTITFTQQAERSGSLSYTASNTITFTQPPNIVAGPKRLTASNALSLTQTASSGLLTRTASNQITFTNAKAADADFLEVTASNTIAFTQNAAPGLLTRTAITPITFSQSGSTATNLASGIVRTASNTITFTQTNNRIRLLAAAVALTASHTLTLSQTAIFPIELTASQTITFTHSGDGNAGKSATQTITFTQTVVANKIQSLTASNTLNLSQAFTFVQFRDGIPLATAGSCGIEQQYSPLSGGGSSAIRPIPPDYERKTDVVFAYPAGGLCAATSTVTLRTPNFGNRERTQFNRINRESRGGSLKIFRDPTWPKQKTLVMDFSGIKDSEIDDVLTFLETSLGKRISFRDWEGRVWRGVIVNPDTAITKQGTNRNDIAIELEVDDTFLELNACNTLSLSQSNARVVTP